MNFLNVNSIMSSEDKILAELDSKALKDDKYWSFKGRSKRTQCHALIQYPAMMVPEMQGELIDIVQKNVPIVSSIYDPFVGSGTTLGEALIRGLDFGGTDINPLAILACEVKTGPFYIDALKTKIEEVLDRINADLSNEVDVDFFGRDKWFIPRVVINLCKIRRAIRAEKSKWARKFFWVALSDTVRATCNSRSSTYKLHIKEEANLDKVRCPSLIFKEVLTRNLQLKIDQKKVLELNQHLKMATHSSKIILSNEDVKSETSKLKRKYDLLVTSPPYGDNGTTVPYGQFSYLSLQWIDVNDIDAKIDPNLLANTASIDTAGLGGSKNISESTICALRDASVAFQSIYKSLQFRTNDRGLKRYVAFFRDLEASLPRILDKLHDDAYMLWTLGNRHIGGMEIPLNTILREFLETHGAKFVHEIEREIPTKRMASRNRASKTMTKETVLIMKKVSHDRNHGKVAEEQS